MTNKQNTQKPWPEDSQGPQARDAKAILIQRKDQDRFGWASRQGQRHGATHCQTVDTQHR